MNITTRRTFMLMQKKRFRFDNKYIYGSAAFIAGFGGLMALFVNFAPLNVPSANIATIPEVPKNQEVTSESADASQNDVQTQPKSSASNNNVPASQPTVKDNGIVASPVNPIETPSPTTTDPVVPISDIPTVPVGDDPETPVLPEIPIVNPVIEELLP
jgi:hypothetical protein